MPVHKGKDPTDKTNYRLVSLLPLFSKVFEKMQVKLYDYMENSLNHLLRSFHKAQNFQNNMHYSD